MELKVKLLSVKQDKISGWAFVEGSEKPVKVRLFRKGKIIKEVMADKPRKGVVSRGIHPTGNVGFAFSFKKKPISPNESIELEFLQDEQSLGRYIIVFVKGEMP